MILARGIALAAAFLAGAAGAAQTASGSSASSRFCDRTHPLTASEQDQMLRFTGVVRDELAASGSGVVLISRSGLDLSRFNIRYSHAAIAWRGENGAWSARQLYYACDETRPRIYDQGLAGFTMGIDDPSLGYISIVRLSAEATRLLDRATRDTRLALDLLGSSYSANAYPFSLRYQNCNQWVMEMLAAAWGELPDGDDLRARAQGWLRESRYSPEPVDVDSRVLMFASHFVPLLHLDDHPEAEVFSMKLEISLPSTVETFIHDRLPGSERVELCHDGRRVVLHRGWTRIADGCRPGEGDELSTLD